MAGAAIDLAYNASLLSGNINGQSHLGLTAQQPIRADWKVGGIEIEEALQMVQDEQPTHKGVLGSEGQVQAMLADWPASLAGSGTLTIEKGQLMNLPVIKQLVALMAKATFGVAVDPEDRADVTFDIRPDRVTVKKMEVISALVALRGKGDMYYDRRLDLGINAGVLEKLQSSMGRVGNILAALSDGAVTYHVGGTTDQPVITIRPLGFGL